MLCRDFARGNKALKDVRSLSGNNSVYMYLCDLTSLSSIENCCKELKNNFTFWRAYSQSKLANVLFTYELAERLKGTGVTVNCLHPGAVATNMGINRQTGFGKFITRLLKPFFQTPEKGASTSIYLATSNEVKEVSGKYFYRKKPIESSKSSHDKDLAKRLWKLSEELTDL